MFKHSFKNVKVIVLITALGTVSNVYSAVIDKPADPLVTDKYAKHQDEREAKADDVLILAKQAGLPPIEVEKSIDFQERFSDLIKEIFDHYPGKVSAVWMAPVPETKAFVRFIGEVPQNLETDFKTKGVNPSDVVVAGGDMISLDEQKTRAHLAASALLKAGYTDAMVFFDSSDQTMHVNIILNPGARAPNDSDIAAVIQKHIMSEERTLGEKLFQNERARLVDERDLNLKIIKGVGPMMSFEHSRGGNWLRDNGANECTSGWAVNGPSGNGIITAGHCAGLDQFVQPGVAPYSMTWQSQHMGALGDVEYHTTSHIEVPEFYASSSSIRNVSAMKLTFTMLGGSVCRYGRSSNIRTCNHTVTGTYVNVISGGTLLGSMVTASNHSGIPGDSGGGWSWGNTAWGVHSGSIPSTGESVFTPILEGTLALGTVLLF